MSVKCVLIRLIVSQLILIVFSIEEKGFCEKDGLCEIDNRSINNANEHDLVDLLEQKSTRFPLELSKLKELIWITNRLISIQSSQEDYYLPRRTSQQEAVDKLNQWAKNELGIDGVEGQITEGIGLGLVATKHFKKGDTVMKIHVEQTFSTQRSRDRLSCLGHLVPKVSKLPGFWPQLNLSLVILAESYKKDTPYRIYLNALPTTFTHPINFTYDDYAALQKSFVFETAVNAFCEACSMYAKVWKALYDKPGCSKKIGIDKERFTLKAFRWAYAVALTRNYEGGFHDGEVNKVMIPFWDLANHDQSANIEVQNDPIGPQTDKSDGEYTTYAERLIKKGQPLNFRYMRNLWPDDAFGVWGFPSVTSYDLAIKLNKSHPNYHNMLKQLKKAEWNNGVTLVDPLGRKNDPLFDVFEDKGMASLLRVVTGSSKVEYTPKLVREAWSFLGEQIDHALLQYDASVEELQKLKNTATSDNLKMVYSQLIAEVALLQRLREYTEQCLDK